MGRDSGTLPPALQDPMPKATGTAVLIPINIDDNYLDETDTSFSNCNRKLFDWHL